MARIVVRRNTEGFISGGVFHPIRTGAGYDAGRLSDDHEYQRERKRKKATAKKKKKPVAKKKAKAKTKRVAKRKNPASFPIGRFVKVEKVRMNRDGTISVLKKKGR